MERDLWSIDEYVVVADLYLRRGRSSGVNDREVVDLARLAGRSPAAISRRLGNFQGTDHPGIGLRPVVGDALAMFRAIQADEALRLRMVAEATARLRARQPTPAEAPEAGGPQLVDPEDFRVESVDITSVAAARRAIRAEAMLVCRYRNWLDPRGERLRGLVIPIGGQLLRADLYDTWGDVLIEAKSFTTRDNLRHAVGQLFDYRRYLTSSVALAILVPSEPDADLAVLPASVDIAVIWGDGEGFTDSFGGLLTDRAMSRPTAGTGESSPQI
jgi:hypothetical protein